MVTGDPDREWGWQLTNQAGNRVYLIPTKIEGISCRESYKVQVAW